MELLSEIAITQAQIRNARNYWMAQIELATDSDRLDECLENALRLARGLKAYLQTPMEALK